VALPNTQSNHTKPDGIDLRPRPANTTVHTCTEVRRVQEHRIAGLRITVKVIRSGGRVRHEHPAYVTAAIFGAVVQAGVMLNQYSPAVRLTGVVNVTSTENSVTPKATRPVVATLMVPEPDAMSVPPLPDDTPERMSYVAEFGSKFASACMLKKNSSDLRLAPSGNFEGHVRGTPGYQQSILIRKAIGQAAGCVEIAAVEDAWSAQRRRNSRRS